MGATNGFLDDAKCNIKLSTPLPSSPMNSDFLNCSNGTIAYTCNLCQNAIWNIILAWPPLPQVLALVPFQMLPLTFWFSNGSAFYKQQKCSSQGQMVVPLQWRNSRLVSDSPIVMVVTWCLAVNFDKSYVKLHNRIKRCRLSLDTRRKKIEKAADVNMAKHYRRGSGPNFIKLVCTKNCSAQNTVC